MEVYKFNKYEERKYILPCGLTIHYFPYPSYHTNMMGFVVPYGSNMSQYLINGKPVKTGIAHFLEHRMFDSKDGDLTSEFARVGASANAFTYYDRTCYYCSTNYDVMAAFKILFRLVSEFYSTKARVDNEKKIIIQEKLGGLSKPVNEIAEKMNAKLFTKSIFKDPVIGSKKDIEETTVNDLKTAFEAFYRLDNMILVVCGPTPIEPLIDYINQNYKPNIHQYKLTKLDIKEDFTKVKYPKIRVQRDIVSRIQNLMIKVDVSELRHKYSVYQYENIMTYALSLLFDDGAKFIEKFNSLDVAYNSLNYQYVDQDDVANFSLLYIGQNSRIPEACIMDALKHPEKYITEEEIEKYEKRMLGSKLIELQNVYSVFNDVTINIDKDYNFLEMFSENKKITLNDIIYFIKCLGQGIILKGVLIPKDEEKGN